MREGRKQAEARERGGMLGGITCGEHARTRLRTFNTAYTVVPTLPVLARQDAIISDRPHL